MSRRLARSMPLGACAASLALVLAACFPDVVLSGDVDGGSVDASTASDAGTVADSSPADAGAEAQAADADADARDADGGAILTDCVLLLHMDEASWTGTGAVKDASGRGNHGTVVGSATPAAGGKFGRGALLDGSGWIDVPDSPSLHATTALTFAAWIAPTGLTDGGASPGVLSKRRGFQDNVAFTLFLWEGNHAWVDVEATRFPSSFVFPNGAFHHVAVVYEAAAVDPSRRARIYVDGALDATHTATTALASNVEDILVGALPGGGSPFTGRIDEVALWTRVLTDAEISGLATRTTPLP